VVEVRIGDQQLRLGWDEWEERVRAGRVPEDALVRFEPVTGDAFRVASELELYRSIRTDTKRAWQGRFRGGAPPILTALLIGLQIRIWWFARSESIREWMVTWGTAWAPPTFENAEFWRPLTMGLLHYQFDHIAMNMVFMAYTSYNLERALGRANLAILFFGSVLVGSVASMFGAPESSSLGASGGVFGLMGASVVFSFVHPDLLPERHRRLFGMAIAPYLVFMLWSGLQRDDIDNFAHVGGMIGGILLTLLLDPPPLQRRPGWNRRVHSTLVAGGVAVLAALAIGGPRLTPLADARTVDRPRRAVVAVDDDVGYRALAWSTPAGWRRGRSSAGDSAFESPAGPRAWGVSLQDKDVAQSVESLAEEWVARLERAFGEVRTAGPSPCMVSGRAGLCQTAEVDAAEGERRLDWTGAVQGVWALEATWEVESDRADWLAPLHERLRRTMEWRDPEELVAARTDVAARATSVKARERLATALARSGHADEAVELQQALINEAPDDPDRWAALFETERIVPGSVPDLDAWIDRALSGDPSVRIVVEVVDACARLDQLPLARGLLRVAWARSPGDRTLKRARRRLGLPTELDASTNLPWDVAVDPATLERRAPEAVDALLDRGLDRDSALAAEARSLREWDALARQVERWLDEGDDQVGPALLAMRDGSIPTEPEDRLARMVEEVTRSDAAPPDWLPKSLTDRLDDLRDAFSTPD
jgi:membrane associated rhomboid family serine protease